MKDKKPILSICIPTYNRANQLERLVKTLVESINKLNKETTSIELLISNNASTDKTHDYLQSLQHDFVNTINHTNNHGANWNIEFCYMRARGKYVWIIGDDDLPDFDLLEQIIYFIKSHSPGVIYISPIYSPDLSNTTKTRTEGKPKIRIMGSRDFVNFVGHLLTFVSSLVVNAEITNKNKVIKYFNKYRTSYIPSLIYSLPVLIQSSQFVCISNPRIKVTIGHTTSYPAMQTFGINYPTIVSDIAHANPEISKSLISSVITWHLPGVAWACRFDNTNKYGDLSLYDQIKLNNNSSFLFKFFFIPIVKYPKPIARLFFYAYRATARARLQYLSILFT